MSKAPPVSRQSSLHESSSEKRERSTGTGLAAASRLMKLTFERQRHLEAAGHRRTADVLPIA
jgi:hypothetical protein